MSVGAYPQTNEEKKVPIIPPWKQCEDKYPDECATEDWNTKCNVTAHKEFMATNCAKTCDLCDASINTGIVDCKSSWKQWGSCTKSCGIGEQVFMQDIEVYPENGGKPCDTETRKTVRCNTQSCPIKVDCEWSTFSKSGPCSKNGEQLYLRTRIIQAENGGKP